MNTRGTLLGGTPNCPLNVGVFEKNNCEFQVLKMFRMFLLKILDLKVIIENRFLA